MKQQNYIEDSLVKDHKKQLKSWSNSKQGRLRNFATYEISHATCEILQVAKIRNIAKTSALLPSPSVFSSNFLLTYTCSFEFGSGSSYLSSLDDNGVIGLQTTKITTKYNQ